MTAVAIITLLLLLTTFVVLWQHERNRRDAAETRCRQLAAIVAITGNVPLVRTQPVLRANCTPHDATRFLHLELRR